MSCTICRCLQFVPLLLVLCVLCVLLQFSQVSFTSHCLFKALFEPSLELQRTAAAVRASLFGPEVGALSININPECMLKAP